MKKHNANPSWWPSTVEVDGETWARFVTHFDHISVDNRNLTHVPPDAIVVSICEWRPTYLGEGFASVVCDVSLSTSHVVPAHTIQVVGTFKQVQAALRARRPATAASEE